MIPELIGYRPMMDLMKGNYQYSLALFVRLTFCRARILPVSGLLFCNLLQYDLKPLGMVCVVVHDSRDLFGFAL